MQRQVQVTGGKAVLLHQEVEPSDILKLSRRTGSVRQGRRGRALGAVVDGLSGSGCWAQDRDIGLGTDFTVGFSVLVGDILEATGTILLWKIARSDGDSFEIFLVRDATGLLLRAKVTQGGAPSVFADSGYTTAGADIHVALRFTASSKLVEFNTSGDLTTDTSVSAEALTLDASGYKLSIGGDPDSTELKPLHRPCVISNLVQYQSYIDKITTFLGTRTPVGSPTDHFKLEGEEAYVDDNSGSADEKLYALPAPPVLKSGLLHFNGRSAALRVELTTEVEQLFSTKVRSVADTHFSFYLKGTRAKTATTEEVLVDFGDLCKITIVATSGFVSFVYNGTTLTTSTATIADGQAYEVYASRDGDTLRLKVIASSTETQTTTSSALVSPDLDFARIPKLWIGADEDATLATNFGGSLEIFALFKESVMFNPGPGPAALLYVDAGNLDSAVGIEDQGPIGVGIQPVSHTTEDAHPAYAPGPIADATYVGVSGGEVLGEGSLVGYDVATQRYLKKLAKDATTARFGENLLITSGDKLHVAHTRKQTLRPLGVPTPNTEVSTLSVAPGVLGGAAAYGYRAVTRDGTHGPVRRLDPVVAENAAKVLLGSSAGSGDDLSSELGETYAQTKTTSSSVSRLDLATSAGRPFETDDEIPLSVHARIPDFDPDELDELVWARGIYANSGNRTHFTTKQTSLSIDVDSDWTLMAAFRYETSPDGGDYMQAQSIIGIARTEGLRSGSQATGTSVYNADFCAVIYDGGHVAMEADAAGYAPYGKTSPKLVVYISRQEYFQTYGDSGSTMEAMIANYQPLTFTNDSWTAGNDYAVYFVRSGDGLTVVVHDKTAGTKTTLTARSMSALGTRIAYGPKVLPAISAYDGSDFFSGWSPKTSKRGLVFGGGQDFAIQPPFIKESDGQADATDYFTTFTTYDKSTWNFVYNSGGGVAHYHYRFWSRAVNINDLKNHGEKRYAAQPGEPLNFDCQYDFGCVFEDVSETASKVGDGLSTAVQWYALGRARATYTVEYFEQDTAAVSASEQPVVILANNGTSYSAAPFSIYFSELGNGRVVVQASAQEGTFVLSNKIWPGALYNPVRVKLLEDFDTFINDFYEFNWYSVNLKITDSGGGSSRGFQVTSFAINGNRIFDQSIGGNSTEIATWTSDWIYLGGHSDGTTANAYEVEIGEFRLWDDGFGPDVDRGTGFDYLVGRVPSNKLSGLLVYAKMQPSDEYNGGAGKASGINKLYQYGTLSDEFDLQDATGRAVIYDTRTEAQSGSDPAPQVSFPENPREDIVAYELCRTRFVPLLDYDDEAERQTALDTARGRPLFLLARIPVGTTHFLDNSPDETLGESIQYEEYSTPPVAQHVALWQGQVAVATKNRRVFFSEPGPFGWETFPSRLIYQAQSEGSGGSDITAIKSTGTELYLLGTDWAVGVVGSPGAETEVSLGNGVGAFNARCVVNVSGKVYAFNGRLWELDRTGQVDIVVKDVGDAVQDLLPTDADNSRLALSRDLQSLFVINETTGDALRIFLPTGKFTKEKRDALALGDNSSNVATWVTLDGAYATENSGTYSDDAESTSTTTFSAGTIASDVFTCDSAPTDVHVGMRVGVVDANGDSVDGRITAVASGVITLTSGDLSSLADGAGTIYYGVSAEGFLVDSGYVDTSIRDAFLRHLVVATQAGSSLEYGGAASPVTGDREALTDVQFATVAQDQCGVDMRGRFVRAVLRNRTPEQTKVTYLGLEVETPDGT